MTFTPGCLERISETAASSFERVLEARTRRPGDCEARERAIAKPRELGDVPVITTLVKCQPGTSWDRGKGKGKASCKDEVCLQVFPSMRSGKARATSVAVVPRPNEACVVADIVDSIELLSEWERVAGKVKSMKERPLLAFVL